MQVKNEGGVEKGWLNPERFVFWHYVLCYLLSYLLFLIYLPNVCWYNER